MKYFNYTLYSMTYTYQLKIWKFCQHNKDEFFLLNVLQRIHAVFKAYPRKFRCKSLILI